MGFFGDMKSINKIYGLLNALEKDVVDYVGDAQSSTLIMRNRSYFENKERVIRNQLDELSFIAGNSSDTVQSATFEFMNNKGTLGQLIWGLKTLVDETSRRIRKVGK